jgi:tetratricopeptide (TPR) repeat protein
VVGIYPPMRVSEALKRAEKPPRSAITESLGLEICKREGLQAVVLGAVSRLGSSYLLAVRAVGVNSATLMSSQTQVQTPDEVPVALDKMVAELRSKLGELPAEMKDTSAPLAQVTSGSLDAISHFTQGKELLAMGRFDDARSQFQQALQLDPKFAMARADLGLSYSLRDREGAVKNLYQATQMLSKVTEKERLKILGDYNLFAGNPDAAIGYYQALSELQPLDPAPLINMTGAYLERGDVRLGFETAQRAAAMAPSFIPLRINLVRFALFSGDLAKAYSGIVELRKAVPDNTAGANVMAYHSDVLVTLGKFAEARALLDEMIRAGGDKEVYGRAALADLDLAQGHYADARVQLRAGIAAANKAKNSFFAFKDQILLAEVSPGDPPAGIDQEIETEHDPSLLFLLGKWYASVHQPAKAQKIFDTLNALAEKNADSRLQSLRSMLGAEIALDQGKSADAVQAAEQAVRDQNSTWALEVLGDVYSGAGRDKDAARAYALVLARATERAWLPEDPAFYRVAQLHDRAGVLFQKIGDTAHAREQLQAFVDLGASADPGIPAYEDAKKRLSELGK